MIVHIENLLLIDTACAVSAIVHIGSLLVVWYGAPDARFMVLTVWIMTAWESHNWR